MGHEDSAKAKEGRIGSGRGLGGRQGRQAGDDYNGWLAGKRVGNERRMIRLGEPVLVFAEVVWSSYWYKQGLLELCQSIRGIDLYRFLQHLQRFLRLLVVQD